MSAAAEIRIERADLARADHAEALLLVLEAYVREPHIAGAPLPVATRRALVPALRAHPGTQVLLAFDGVEAVGGAVCFTGFSTFAAQPLLNLHDVAVVASHRGRGVGRALLEAAATLARELGCCKLTLEVRADNQRARRVYARFGFADSAPGGEPVTTHFLEKRL